MGPRTRTPRAILWAKFLILPLFGLNLTPDALVHSLENCDTIIKARSSHELGGIISLADVTGRTNVPQAQGQFL